MPPEEPVAAPLPTVPVTLQFDPSLGPLLGAGGLVGQAFQRAVASALAELLATLGIPGQPDVAITLPAPAQSPGGQFMAVVVNGSTCPYPDDLLDSVHAYVTGVPPQSSAGSQQLRDWLRALADPRSDPAGRGREQLVQFLVLGCLESVKLNPAVLLGVAQAQALIASLPVPTGGDGAPWPPPAGFLLPVLRAVLGLRISLADPQAVADVLGRSRGRAPDDVAEALIAALRPPITRIQIERAYLKQLTLPGASGPGAQFALARDRLFTRLGLPCPDLHFAPVDRLKPGSFAFQINHLATPPFIGLQPDQCFVDDTPDGLSLLGVDALPAINPETGQPGGIVAMDQQQMLRTAGLTLWDPWDYLLLCFGGIFRTSAACLLDSQETTGLLNRLGADFPALVNPVRALALEDQLTRVLRALVADGLAIRNLPLILDRVLTYDCVYAEAAQLEPAAGEPRGDWGVPSPQPPGPVDLIAFIRAAPIPYVGDR